MRHGFGEYLVQSNTCRVSRFSLPLLFSSTIRNGGQLKADSDGKLKLEL